MSNEPKYRCLLCGRDKFQEKTPHYCVGGYRKHHIKWEEINKTMDNENNRYFCLNPNNKNNTCDIKEPSKECAFCMYLLTATQPIPAKIKKPPLGLIPKWAWDEERLREICKAISRYYNNERVIPIEWIEEYNKLIEKTKL